MIIELSGEQFEFLRQAISEYHGVQIFEAQRCVDDPYPISRRQLKYRAMMRDKAEGFLRYLDQEKERQERL